MELSLIPTVILLITSVFFTILFGYLGGRTLGAHEGPRMVPWRFLMILTFTVALLMIVHVLTMMGLKTDQPLRF